MFAKVLVHLDNARPAFLTVADVVSGVPESRSKSVASSILQRLEAQGVLDPIERSPTFSYGRRVRYDRPAFTTAVLSARRFLTKRGMLPSTTSARSSPFEVDFSAAGHPVRAAAKRGRVLAETEGGPGERIAASKAASFRRTAASTVSGMGGRAREGSALARPGRRATRTADYGSATGIDTPQGSCRAVGRRRRGRNVPPAPAPRRKAQVRGWMRGG